MGGMTTYENVGAALADPKSNISRFVRDADALKAERIALFTEWQAQGATPEECWTRYLAAA